MSRNQSSFPRPSAAELRALYVDQGLGCPEIGRMLERDASTIRGWLIAAGIPTRPRGSDLRQHFRRGGGDPRSFAGTKHSPQAIAKIRAATVASGRVPFLRNGEHWLKSAAPKDNPNWQGGRTPERQAFYRTAEWAAAVRSVWARADACCQRCRLDWRTVDRKVTPTFHVHHVVSFQVRECRAEPAFLVLLCRPCHLFVHSNANSTRAFLLQDAVAAPLPSLADFDAWESLGVAGRPPLFNGAGAAA